MNYDYDLIVIGGGAAGLIASGIGGVLGARTLLVEMLRPGGDCTWTGCIPSKTLIRSAAAAHAVHTASSFGVDVAGMEVDGRAVFDRIRSVRRRIFEASNTPQRIAEFGVEVVHARASFTGSHAVHLETTEASAAREVTGRRIIVATGSRPTATGDVMALDAPFLTSDTLFELNDLPESLTVVGGGPTGIEVAQAFGRLGVRVNVLERAESILPLEDREATRLLQDRLTAEGVTVTASADVRRIERVRDGIRIHYDEGGRPSSMNAEHVLIAVGRTPNVDLDLDRAGVEYDEGGINVDSHGRTNKRHIYAAGDVTGTFYLTHMSEHSARVAVLHALTRYPARVRTDAVPRVVFTDPEIASVGIGARDLELSDRSFEMYRFPYERIDRAVTDGCMEGFVKVFARRRNGRLLGAVVAGTQAGELAGQIALAMRNGLSLRQISDTIFPYLTYGLGVRRAADQWHVRRYPVRLIRMLGRIQGYRGNVFERGSDRII